MHTKMQSPLGSIKDKKSLEFSGTRFSDFFSAGCEAKNFYVSYNWDYANRSCFIGTHLTLKISFNNKIINFKITDIRQSLLIRSIEIDIFNGFLKYAICKYIYDTNFNQRNNLKPTL